MDAPRKRSQLVTVLAWLSIVGSGMGVLIGVAQFLLWDTIFGEVFDEFQHDPEAMEQIPAHLRFMVEDPKTWIALFASAAVLVLGASIGVLLRHQWGRFAFIGVMGLAILATLATIPAIFVTPAGFDHPDMPSQMDGFLLFSQGLNLLYTLGAVALYAGVIYKLVTPPIRDEFS